jgi:ribosome maturation factor RimP
MNQTLNGSYHLEVSSPGVDRPLRTLESVSRFSGRPAVIALREPHEGRRNFEGELIGPDGTRVGVRGGDGEHWFEWDEIRSARLNEDPWSVVRSRGENR